MKNLAKLAKLGSLGKLAKLGKLGESGRWTDKKPTGLAVTHGGYQYKPYEMEMK